MSFWGASDAQKEATGRARELGAWNFGQIPSWLGRADYGAGQGEQLGQWGQDYWKNLAQQGFYTPEEVRGFGQQIMPGVDQAVANRQARLEGTSADWGNTEADIRQRMDQQAGNINTTFDQGRDTIAGAYGRVGQRGADVNREVTGNIGETYGSAAKQAADTYGGLRDASAGTYDRMSGDTGSLYGGLRGDTGSRYGRLEGDVSGTFGGLTADNASAYGTAGQTLDRLNPSGDFRAATAARSFAPAMAATQRRLRAAGIDQNSPEAAALLGRVDQGRARAMDDAYADANTQFVDRKNALTLGQAGVNRDLALGRLDRAQSLGREAGAIDRGLATDAGAIQRQTAADRLMNAQGLSERGGAIDRDLALQSGGEFRNEIRRNQGLSNDVDLGYLGASQTNDMNRFNALQGQFNQGNQFAGQAYNTRAGLTGQLNDEELQRLNLQNAQWGAGMNYGGVQRGGQNQAAQQLGQLGQQYTQNAFGAANQAQGFGRGAQGAYDQSYGYEAPNAGWGTKLIAGAAGAALGGPAGASIGTRLAGAGRAATQQGGYTGAGWPGSQGPYGAGNQRGVIVNYRGGYQ